MGYFVSISRLNNHYNDLCSDDRKKYEEFLNRKHTLYEYKARDIRHMYNLWAGCVRSQIYDWMAEQEGVMYRHGNSFYFTHENTLLLFILTFVGRTNG